MTLTPDDIKQFFMVVASASLAAIIVIFLATALAVRIIGRTERKRLAANATKAKRIREYEVHR